MQARPETLARHLSGPPAPVYLVAGEETLLVEEACAAILAHALTAGFTERSVMHAEGTFKWHDLNQEAASLSLFAERRVIDLRVTTATFDKTASEALTRYIGDARGETLLLIRAGRLDKRQRQSKWFEAIDDAGVIVLVWPMELQRLPGWLAERARGAGIELTPDGIEYLAGRIEGNLLAAAQEIEKLRLADLRQPIDADSVAAVVEDSSHFDTFELIDAAFAGEIARVHRILPTLREEGVAIFAILGALASQLRMIQAGRGGSGPRQRLAGALLRRVGSIGPVLAQCALVDQQAKGALRGDAWLSLENLLLRMAGSRTLPSLETQLRDLK